MLGKEIIKLLNAKPLKDVNFQLLEEDYAYVFATDLMSDALAMIQHNPEKTILLTGLCNHQALRTAEMLDVGLIIFVRDKSLKVEELTDEDSKANVYTTSLTMFESCGILYQQGLKAPSSNV